MSCACAVRACCEQRKYSIKTGKIKTLLRILYKIFLSQPIDDHDKSRQQCKKIFASLHRNMNAINRRRNTLVFSIIYLQLICESAQENATIFPEATSLVKSQSIVFPRTSYPYYEKSATQKQPWTTPLYTMKYYGATSYTTLSTFPTKHNSKFLL